VRAGNPSPTANLFIHAFIPRATLTHDAGRMVYLLVSPYAAVAPSAAPVLVAFFVAYCWVAHALAHRSSPMIVLRLGLALGEMAFVPIRSTGPATSPTSVPASCSPSTSRCDGALPGS